MQKNSSGIIHILLILVVVTVVGIVLIFEKDKLSNFIKIGNPSPAATTDTSSDLKTYTGDQFSFKYPSNFYYQEPVSGYLNFSTKQNLSAGQYPDFSVDFRMTGFTETYDKEVLQTQATLTNITTDQITDGVVISGKVGPGMGEGTSVIKAIIKYKNAAIIFETTNGIISRELFDQIVSTFKFNDETNDSTSDWRVYTNPEIGFHIKYPLDYQGGASPGVQGWSFNPTWGTADFFKGFQNYATLVFFPFNGNMSDLSVAIKNTYTIENYGFKNNPNPTIPFIFRSQVTNFLKPVKVDGYSADWYQSSDGKTNEVRWIAKGYGFVFTNSQGYYDEHNFGLMLSTFKFE